jgi:hypothetical protein
MNGKPGNYLYSDTICLSQSQLLILIILILIASFGFNQAYEHVFDHEQNIAAGFGQMPIPFAIKQGRFDERVHFSNGKKT